MNKRILAAIISLIMLLTIFPMTVLAANEYAPKLKIEASYENNKVTVTVKTNAYSQCTGAQIDISYPNDKVTVATSDITCTGVLSSASLNLKDVSGNKVISAAWDDTTARSCSSEETILTAVFTVIEGQSGECSFSISYYCFTDGDEEIKVAPAGSTTNTSATIPAPTVAVTGISLNETSLNLTAGESKTLTATITPDNATDKTVTWTSSKPSVATVENGKVTAVAAGNATITAKAGSFTATCDVTVTAAPCTHPNKTEVAEKASTCAEKGWDAYKKCNDCGQLFNASGNEISEIPYRDLSTTHTEGTPATCTTKAVCSVCNQPYGALDPTKHSGTLGSWVTTDANKHWKEYSCCQAHQDEAAHIYADAQDTTCNICGHVREVTPPTETFTVSFDANGGTGTMTSVSGISGNYTLPECTFTNGVKVFKGWAKSENGDVLEGTTITVSENITLYAIWGNRPVACPVAITGLKYNTHEQTGVAEGEGYTLAGHKATNAGAYTATATLKDGYEWSDGSQDTARPIPWKIDKATLAGKPIFPTVGSDNVPLSQIGEITYPEGWGRGELSWTENTGENVVKGKTYHWKFTPDDNNYAPVEGTVILWPDSGSSTVTIITSPDSDNNGTKENPGTGAAPGSIGYVFVGLVTVGALCFGAKKFIKKDEE